LSVVDEVVKLIPMSDSKTLVFLYSAVETNISYIYTIWMVGQYGQTLGKMALSIKIVDHVTEGKIGYYQSFLREAIPMVLVNITLVFGVVMFADRDLVLDELSAFEYVVIGIPSVMLFIWSILEIVTMLMDSKNRALHDKVAGTVVVKC
jgi:uncharacterized RDD family membrane protein YckC